MSNKQRLVVVDLNFCWPPDSGAPVHLHWILEGYAKNYDVTLLIPRITKFSNLIQRPWPISKTKFFLRGSVDSSFKPSYKIILKDYTAFDFLPKRLMKNVRDEVEKLNPDHVFIADGWFLKPYICLALKKWKPVLRLFSHEMLCIQGHGMMYRNNRACTIDYLDVKKGNLSTCIPCSVSFLAKYPSPRWVFEYIWSGAFLPSFRRICKEAFDSVRLIHVGNQYVKTHLQPFTTTPVEVIPNFVDHQRFRFEEKLQQPKLKILIVGRMDSPSKGIVTLMKALEMCWSVRQDFVVKMVTNSPAINRPFIEHVGWVNYENIPKVYCDADITIVPSLLPDIHPNVIFEAAASGVPTIGSNVGGIPEQIQEGITGFLFQPGNEVELADKILWALGHRDEIKEMGRRARETVEKNFTAEGVFQKFYTKAF